MQIIRNPIDLQTEMLVIFPFHHLNNTINQHRVVAPYRLSIELLNMVKDDISGFWTDTF